MSSSQTSIQSLRAVLCSIVAWAAAPFARSRTPKMTFAAPKAAYLMAASSPKPEFAPVMIIFCPSKEPVSFFGGYHFWLKKFHTAILTFSTRFRLKIETKKQRKEKKENTNGQRQVRMKDQ